jgi:exo-beta-1,3-glucanase (GH17 family)
MPSARILLSLLFILVVQGLGSWLLNRPQDAGMEIADGKMMSLSFAPYHDGYSPITGKNPLPEHIDQDLELIKDKTLSIRTYSIQGGMEPTPDFARKHGVALIQGGWLGPNQEGNKREMAALIKAANQHADVIKRVIVGNEVLLRNDMDVDTLIGYIREVKQAVKQPVSYADAWGTYFRYPQLIREVDFVTIHILPYWEDEPIVIEHATEHVEQIVIKIKVLMADMGEDKPIMIGESGWPAAGRQRGLAVPSLVNQARYIRGLIEVANRHHFDYNIVEAFNQNWKSQHEGVVGANWGMLSIDRKPVFPFSGQVVENPHWSKHFGFSCLLGVVIAAYYFRKLKFLPLPQLLMFLTLNQLFTLALVSMAQVLISTSYENWQKLYALGMMLVNTGLLVLLVPRIFRVLARLPVSNRLAKLFKAAYLGVYLLALYNTYDLAFNGRYLSFPTEQFTLPALGVAGLLLAGWFARQPVFAGVAELTGGHDRWLVGLMAFGVAALLIGETNAFLHARDFVMLHPGFWNGLPLALLYTLRNGQLIEWVLVVAVLSLPFWRLASIGGLRSIELTHPTRWFA